MPPLVETADRLDANSDLHRARVATARHPYVLPPMRLVEEFGYDSQWHSRLRHAEVIALRPRNVPCTMPPLVETADRLDANSDLHRARVATARHRYVLTPMRLVEEFGYDSQWHSRLRHAEVIALRPRNVPCTMPPLVETADRLDANSD